MTSMHYCLQLLDLQFSSAGAMPFQITITKTYNTTNLFEDIKGLYKVAGVKGQPVAFIFTDNEVKEEGFLEYINQILMTGEVAGLFQKDELDAIVNDIRPIMKAESPGQYCMVLMVCICKRNRLNMETPMCSLNSICVHFACKTSNPCYVLPSQALTLLLS